MISYIGYTPENNASYAVQYQDAFEYLFNNRSDAKKELKSYDLPLLYLLRHYMELSFKYNIEYFKDYSECQDMLGQLSDSHDVEKLYIAFKSHLDKSIEKIPENIEIKTKISSYFTSLKKLVDNLKELDIKGENLRYSHDKKGVITLDSNKTIDLVKDIAEPYQNCKELLDYSVYVYKDFLKKQDAV